MTDTEQLKTSCDLRRLVEQDLGDALKLLNSNYKSLSDKAQEKMAVLSRLIGGRNDTK